MKVSSTADKVELAELSKLVNRSKTNDIRAIRGSGWGNAVNREKIERN